MSYSLAPNLLNKWGYNILKSMMTPKFIFNQIKWEYEVCHEDPIAYQHLAIQLASTFDGFYINDVSRLQNTKAAL